nr:tape measure protein [Shouchella lehensis]
MLDDGSVAKGVADIDGKLSGLQGSGEKGAIGIGKIVTALGLVALGAKAIGLVKDSIDRAFGRIDTMEQFERVMTTMTGSSEKANEVLDTTNDIVTGTAYGLDVAASAVQGFVTSNMGVDQATESIAAWGDAVAFYGDGSNESFASVSTALSQMYAKGKVQMDTMNRLTEAGIPAMQIYADATGQSVEEVADQMSKGKLDAESFMNVMNDAIANGTENFAGIKGAAKEAGASWSGSFDNMRAAVARGVTSIIQNLDEMLTNNGLPDMRTMVSEFGKAFEKALKTAAEMIPIVVDKAKEIYKTMEPWIPLLSAIAIGMGTVYTAVATWNSAVFIVKLLDKAMKALNLTMFKNPFVLLAVAIVAAAILIYQYWEPISAFFQDLWNKIKLYAVVAWEAIKSVWSAAVDWVKDTWSSVTAFFSNLWIDVSESATSIWDSIKAVWTSTIEWFKSIWQTVSDFFVGLWDGIVEVAVSIWDTITTKWNEVVALVTTLFAPLIEFFVGLWETVSANAMEYWNNITTMFSTVWTNIQTAAAAAWELIKNVILGPILLLIDLVTGDMEGFKEHLSAIWENIKENASIIWRALTENITVIIQTAIANVSLIWDTFKTYVTGVWTAIWQTAVNIFNHIKDSIVQKMEEAKSWISTTWENIKKNFNEALAAVLRWTITKFLEIKNAVRDKMREALMLIISIWNQIRSFFISVIASILATVIRKFNDIKSAIRERMNDAKNTIQNIWNTAQRFLANVNLFSIGKDIIAGLIRGIGSMAKKVWNKVTEITDGIKEKITGALGIFSPSRWMRDEVGVMLMRGFGIGIDKEKSATIGKMEQAAEWMKPELPEVSAVMNDIKGLASGLATSIPVHFRNSVPNTVAAVNGFNPTGEEDSKIPVAINLYVGSKQIASEIVDDISRLQDRDKFRLGRNRGGK